MNVLKKSTLVLILGTLACATEPYVWEPPYSYHAWTPLSWYPDVWDSTVRCAGSLVLKNPPYFEEVRWFEMDGDLVYRLPDGRGAIGAWDTNKRVFFAKGAGAWKWIVAHEALHGLTGIKGHPVDPFDRCVRPWWQPEPGFGVR